MALLICCEGANKKDSFNLNEARKDSAVTIVEKDKLEDAILSNDSLDFESNRTSIEKSIVSETRFALNNENGVPYYNSQIGVFIEGFDVGKDGSFYFLGGDQEAILVKYTGRKVQFRKKYPDINPSSFYNINDSTILMLNKKYSKNELFWVDSRDGAIINSFGKIIENKINSCHFTDSTLIVKAFNITDSTSTDTELGVLKFDTRGNLLGYAENVNNVKNEIVRIGVSERGVAGNWMLGIWNGNYLKLIQEINGHFNLYVIGTDGNIIEVRKFDSGPVWEALFGSSYKLINNNLYVMRQENMEVVISIFDMEELHPPQLVQE
ncbi:hypothetical protein [Reichenbachiella sp.]|uniref:hypothetical protein n=1 Tax=Reichenbachiella sp. TaxID=2184521 RepID=UPI003296B6C4